MPVVVKEAATDPHRGPVLVTVEYILLFQNAKRSSWKRSINMLASGVAMGLIGGVSTEILKSRIAILEIFLVNSWAEHLRQHERHTQADHELERRLSGYAASDPMVRHLIYANSIET